MHWARVISDLLSPPIVWAVMVFPIAFHYATSRSQALLWALTYGILVCLLPIVYIAWMVHQGRITDVHMKERAERIRPFAVSILCSLLAWQILHLMGAPPILPLVAGVTLVQMAVMTLITLVWQISMHTMSITVAVIATGYVFGPASALAVSPLVPLVGAARLKLNRHTPAQVIGGTIIGALIPLLMIALLMSPV